jgi:hypothetical protein
MKEQVIKLVKQAGFQKFLKPADRPGMICDPATLERFAALVRNAALEEAAKVCFAMPAPTHCNRAEANLCDVMTAQCENEIRNLKEPTP